MSDGIEARRAALRVLTAVGRGMPFDAALDAGVEGLSSPDRRLAHELAAGVLRQRAALDARLRPLVARGWRRVAPPLRDVLRLGAYQLTALDRVPPHAAVDTSVELARETVGGRAPALVNAVLRRLGARQEGAESREASARPSVSSDADATVTALAERYSHPAWLVARWRRRFGAAETERLLAWNNTRPKLVVQPAREPADRLVRRFAEAGIPVEPAPYGAGLVVGRGRPAELPGYPEGAFVVQDPAQALVAWYADPPPGTRVYDACAAPGGKAIALGRTGVEVVAADADPARVRRLRENLGRAGTGREHPVVADARHPPVRAVDVVLVDAPCLGTGTLARHPDARWRVSPEALASLTERQRALLEAAARTVRPGGWLVYATCSLEPEENEQQVDRFLAEHPEFAREPPSDLPRPLLTEKGDLMTLPHRDRMDGAFAARLRRRP